MRIFKRWYFSKGKFAKKVNLSNNGTCIAVMFSILTIITCQFVYVNIAFNIPAITFLIICGIFSFFPVFSKK